MKNRNFRRPYFSMRGFTLIELMVVVIIIGIISAIAYPSYTQYIRKARRAEAKSMLQEIQLVQERYRANNNTYGTLTNLGWSKTLTYYDLDINPNTASTYTIKASAKTGSSQIDDKQGATECKNLALTQSGKTPAVCW